MPVPLKVVHLIGSLKTGGAQGMLARLLSALDRGVVDSSVIALGDNGPLGKRIESLGIPVLALGLGRAADQPKALARLAGLMRRSAPDLVQTWVYHSNLMGGLAAKLAGGIPVIWNLRRSGLDGRIHRRLTRWTARGCGALSSVLPARIVCGSEAACRVHAELGYRPDRMVVIDNGFDVEAFRPDPEARRAVRRELGVPDDTLLLGRVGRFHPDKDYETLMAAAASLHWLRPDVHFLLCGPGVDRANGELSEWVRKLQIADRCHLLGAREDVARLTAALDVAVSSSCSEGFPNVVAEAMACGVPCVVTDVGDSARIVGDAEVVVPPGDWQELAAKSRTLLEKSADERRRVGMAARRRIEQQFSLPLIAARYLALYQDVAARAASTSRRRAARRMRTVTASEQGRV